MKGEIRSAIAMLIILVGCMYITLSL